ncbi:MAG: hypothetical protein GTO63_32430 [Anaerolineae bacterium]|nr:hypothetical protein [Anaerolineae bacterium]NIN99359.1 hypothetical protein [Anaerolineae bacterium]NIQ82224.1 hypothetical protein [Anaerolineae bacterium]
MAGARLKYVVGGGVILVVLGWLIFSNIQGPPAPCLTVEELLFRGPLDRMVRVSVSHMTSFINAGLRSELVNWQPGIQKAEEGRGPSFGAA